jgi:hypothetical protein
VALAIAFGVAFMLPARTAGPSVGSVRPPAVPA